ncbi:SixA phosphatase family protein [Sphingobacterium sp. SGL-16]|jgi:phosphohistidine phosphatase|uniref:SixA phosphatase family protein n=1 Tax=Sphingobacterium sp. SGL-16 TaxID=2710883 RepID=UPI0013EB6D99|nr:histidine phosphatase family protein [Sphingobacterium sp. SGL-16]NGM72632.1 phosphohistidine phosphatase [Sphingobacterium sp. SGL-16]
MSNKILYLIRHGKAEDHSFLKRDYERNLVEKGINRSQIVAQKIKKQLSKEEILIVSSSANRALQTAEVFGEIVEYSKSEIQQESSIYEAYYTEILKVINKVDNKANTVFIFGHNPGLSDLTNYLCNSYIDLKTSHAAKIILPEGFNFSEVSGSTCQLEGVITE